VNKFSHDDPREPAHGRFGNQIGVLVVYSRSYFFVEQNVVEQKMEDMRAS
jgi:hypothetical protein